MNDFAAYANSFIQMLLIPMTNVFNMDETHVSFSVESNRIHADEGSRSVSVAG